MIPDDVPGHDVVVERQRLSIAFASSSMKRHEEYASP
jgi:hypothetical protein